MGPSSITTNILTPRAFISRKDEFLPTLIKKGASIGAGAIIICGITIGEYALIGAGSVVTKDVPDYALVYGNPARIQGKVNKEGGDSRLVNNADDFLETDNIITVSITGGCLGRKSTFIREILQTEFSGYVVVEINEPDHFIRYAKVKTAIKPKVKKGGKDV